MECFILGFEQLILAATAVRSCAYAPYSGYLVGAAVQDFEGRIWAGANFENVSYGASICAERAAVAKMISDGGRQIARVAVVTEDGGSPCGMCLQVLLEFTTRPDFVEVWMVDGSGQRVSRTLGQLIPFGFQSKSVLRTETPL